MRRCDHQRKNSYDDTLRLPVHVDCGHPRLRYAIAAAEPFYQGKTLRVIVASAAGGGSDIVARLMMRHLPRHIPGNPTIIVENMPGAGEIIGTNYVYGKAKPDGLTALFATGTPINQLIELPGIEFDVTKMPIIGGSSESVAAFVRTDKTGVKSARDLLNPKRPSSSAAPATARSKTCRCWRR